MADEDWNNNPMIRIDGARARDIRERKGLTQLYVATAVGVTTETISRWENRRYQSVKAENAEKLAEALEVELAEIIEVGGQEAASPVMESSPAGSLPALPPRLKRHLSIILMIILVMVAVQTARYFSGRNAPAIKVSAERILPPHVPAGQKFPVLVLVEASEEVSFSLLVREALPPGCQAVAAVPEYTSADRDNGMLKWVSRLEGRSRIFAYLLSSPEVPDGTQLLFKGKVLGGRQGTAYPDIGGDQLMVIDRFHWADRNRDNRIDDEEVLAVYDLYGELPGLGIGRDLIDEIWAGGGYRWDESERRYKVNE